MINKKIIQDTIKLIEELCLLLQPLHPVETLKRAYWEFFVQHLEKETESAIGIEAMHSCFLVEYLQSLFISIDLKEPLKQPNNKEWEEIKKKVNQIYDIFRLPISLVINKDNFKSFQEEDITLFFKVLSSWHIRGKRYVIHEYEHLNKLLSPHDEILKELYKVNALDIAEGVKKVYLNFCSSPKFFQECFNILKQIKPSYDNILKEQSLSEEKFKESLQNKIRDLGLKEKKEELENKLFKEDLFDVEKITSWPKNFIKKFSTSIGSNKDFLINGKYPGTPLQIFPIIKKPFLEYNSKFYLFNPYILQDYLYRNIQSAVEEDRPNYSNKWNKKQKTVSENLPFSMLEKIIGQHEQIKNFHYKNQNGNESWFECDGIILFEEWLFVIEVKSGKVSNKPPAQNVVSHFESIQRLLVEPAKQGRRFIETLKQKKTLDLYDEKKRKIIKTISVNDFTQSIVMAVSLEQLTDISPQIQNFKQLRLSPEGEAILFISVDDLRVYRDLSNGVIEFLHFLTERKKAFYNEKLTLDDELDHLGMYLKHSQYHDITKDMPNSNLNIFLGYRDEIDRYFGFLFLDSEKAIKPKQNMPSFLKAIIEDLKLNRKPGFTKIGIVIYSLSDEARKKLDQDILNIMSLQYNKRNIMPAVFSLDNLSVSLIVRMPDIQLDFIPKDYAIKNMFIQEKEEILLLDISVDGENKVTNVSFEWIKKNNLKEESIIKYKEEAKKFADFRFFNKMKQLNKKKIGRNEKCPCGSGKKYKNCHGK